VKEDIYTILRALIRQEIDKTPGFRELTSRSDLPASLDAEKAILGAMMLDNTVNLAEVGVNDFALDSHRLVFAAMDELMEAGKPVDIVTLQQALGENGIKEIGGTACLFSLTEGLPRLPRVAEYIAIVKEKTKLRRIMAGCEKAIVKCAEQSETAASIVDQLATDLKGIRGAK
jgi:replicative DNA helicase